MKKKAENFTAAVFLAVLGTCLVLVLTGVVRVGTGRQEPVGLSYYDPGPKGPTYVSLVKWFEDTCRAFCTTELPGGWSSKRPTPTSIGPWASGSSRAPTRRWCAYTTAIWSPSATSTTI